MNVHMVAKRVMLTVGLVSSLNWHISEILLKQNVVKDRLLSAESVKTLIAVQDLAEPQILLLGSRACRSLLCASLQSLPSEQLVSVIVLSM